MSTRLIGLLSLAIALTALPIGPAAAQDHRQERLIEISPEADGFVSWKRRGRSFGRKSRLVVSGRPRRVAFLRFALPDLGDLRILDAHLWLHVVRARHARGATGGAVYAATAESWSDRTLTFAVRPALASTPLARIGPVRRGQVVRVPITGAVESSQDITLALVGEKADLVRYGSREARIGKPVLVLRVMTTEPEAQCPPGCVDPACRCKPADGCTLDVYGSYSLRMKYAASQEARVAQLIALGGNFVVATGDSKSRLDALPRSVDAAPGCSLMRRTDWKDANGDWSATRANERLAALAEEFGAHPRVWGICISHEVTEFADHDRRAWMYRLAKEHFHTKKVFHYYSRPPPDYADSGQIESDVFFISLPPYTKTGEYDLGRVLRRLDAALHLAERAPGVPVWAQTSINADQDYVTGPETMVRTWGTDGENMLLHAREIFARRSPNGRRLTGFFWRSLGRFQWDLAYPPFRAHRTRMREIADRWRCP